MDRNTDLALYDRLRTHGASRLAMGIALAWGAAEATLFFFIPDIYLGFIAIFTWRGGLRATWFALAGALAGGLLMYILAQGDPAGMIALLDFVPLISAEMVGRVGEQLRAGGLATMIFGPLQGIPYKIYAVQSGVLGLPVVPFLLTTILARVGRFLLIALICGLGGGWLRRFIAPRARLVAGVYCLFWIAVYAGYAWSLR